MITSKKFGRVLLRGMMFVLTSAALIPLSPVFAFIFLAKWLHRKEEPQCESARALGYGSSRIITAMPYWKSPPRITPSLDTISLIPRRG